MNKENEISDVNMSETDHPEWATCIMGKLSFCPKCEQETLLSDGIKMICTNCNYSQTVK